MAHEPGRENCPWAPDTVAVAASARLRVRAFGPAPLRSALSRAIHIPRGIDVTAAVVIARWRLLGQLSET